MNLLEDPSNAFDVFAYRIYGGKLASIALEAVDTHIRWYALAQKFCMEDLSNEVMDVIKRLFKAQRLIGGPSLIEMTYQLTSQGSGLRKVLERPLGLPSDAASAWALQQAATRVPCCSHHHYPLFRTLDKTSSSRWEIPCPEPGGT